MPDPETSGPGLPLPSLTVAFSTRGARALGLRVADWPRAPGVDYLILVQEPDADPRIGPMLAAAAGARPDVSVAALDSTGLSRSRNAALERARGEIVLIADDDVRHLPGAFAGIRRFFAAHPEASLMVGRSFDPAGAPRKRHAPRSRRLTLWNSGRISSHELAIRRAPVLAAGIRFDAAFGIGAGTPNLMGEEYVFVADCLRAGLRGRHLPLPLTVHPPHSSGLVWQGPAATRARAAVFARVFGPAAPLVRLGFGLKHRRRFGGARELFRFVRGR